MRNLTAVVAALAIGAAAAASPVFSPAAQAATTTNSLANPTSLVENLTVKDLTALLTELGATEIETEVNDGTSVIHFKSGTTPFNFGLTLCDVRPGTCLGLVMLVGFDPGATHYPLETFNTFNKGNPFAAAIQLDGNRFAVVRMVITEGGVTRTNLATNIVGFGGAPEAMAKFLASQLVAGNDKDNVTFAPVSQGSGAVNAVKVSGADVGKIARAQAKLPALGKH